jgi:hypothetical protein
MSWWQVLVILVGCVMAGALGAGLMHLALMLPKEGDKHGRHNAHE